jgi:hypothetical protein
MNLRSPYLYANMLLTMKIFCGAYRTLGIDPDYRIICNKCNLLSDGYHIYRVLEHMNDYHRASFKEIELYLEMFGL